ncbi:MAG: hypothetical protein DCF12_11640 [Snowella sp.]|jgi:hypothetical protein|nr:MAG: hypothetical protein DCF12_11640 [Snowella sp.]
MPDTQTNSIPLKTAVSNAMHFISGLYEIGQIRELLVEEVEFSEQTNQWLITIGFTQNRVKDSVILPEREADRKYKIVHIDAQSGEPISMKIREI